MTENGEVEVTRVDGYRVLYKNDKKVPFVNLKIELPLLVNRKIKFLIFFGQYLRIVSYYQSIP